MQELTLFLFRKTTLVQSMYLLLHQLLILNRYAMICKMLVRTYSRSIQAFSMALPFSAISIVAGIVSWHLVRDIIPP